MLPFFLKKGLPAAMGSESVEVQLARVDERLIMVLAELNDAKHGRKEQYEKMEGFRQSLQDMGSKVDNVERKLAGQAPTIEEFITIKHKVVGAGKLGKWLWAIGGMLIGLVYGAREGIATFLTKI